MLKSKISGSIQEVILPDFPDDDNSVTTTVTKSRRVSFGTNFVKEFIVGSAVSAQCIGEYEQAFPSSDSSNADSSQSVGESEILGNSAFLHDTHTKNHKATAPTVSQTAEPDAVEIRTKPPKFSSTICFSADSPTADMEFTEGCITLAKSILDKKNKEMTVIIQAKPKETKDEEKPKEDETKYFDASQFEMSVTRCLKSKENKREDKRFESEKTKIYSKLEDEMSITRCSKVFNDDESDSSWEDCKENRMPLDVIMRHLDKDSSDLENDLFNPEKSFNNLLNPNPFDFSSESEKLNLNESMDISTDLQPNVLRNHQKTCSDGNLHESKASGLNLSEKLNSNESMEISNEIQNDGSYTPDILSIPEHKTLNVNEFERIHVVQEPDPEPEPVQCDQSQSECEKFSNVALDIMPFDISNFGNPSQSESEMSDGKIKNLKSTDEDLRKAGEITEKLETDILQEPEDNEKAMNNKSVHLKSPDKLVVNESQGPESSLLPEGTNINDKSFEERQPMESSTDIQPSVFLQPSSAEKVNHNTALELDRSEALKLDESKMLQSLSSEQMANEKSLELSVSKKLSNDSVMEFNRKFQSQPNNTQNDCDNLNADEPMEICSEEVKMSEYGEGTNDDLTGSKNMENDICAKESLQEVTEISSVVQNVSELLEKPSSAVHDSEKININESEGLTPNIRPNDFMPRQAQSIEEFDEIREPSLVDIKVIESLKEQSKEPGCVWSLKDMRHPQSKTPGLLSFSCELLESVTTIQFILKISNECGLNSCSIVTNSEISLNEENQCRLPEYELVIGFGFEELKKSFHDPRQKVETIRHIPYFLDQVNSFTCKMNSYLQQIHSILTLYPGSRLKKSCLSFRLYSFPIFFSCVVFIDLTDLFRLSDSSLSFESDFGCFDENKIRVIFQDCLKHENPLCEFAIQSTKYLIDVEKESGYVSKRSHIRLLPPELKL